MIKVGIAGVGGLGTIHLRTFLKMKEKVTVAALADPIQERASGEKLNGTNNLGITGDEKADVGEIRSYSDWSGVCMDPDLDVIAIATPSDLHPPAAIMALENGKHVFTEKPMGLNKKDCQRMLDVAKANNKTLMVGQCLRFTPTYMKAKEIMESGKFGKVVSAQMNRYGRTPSAGWFTEEERSGGVNLDLHIHDIDAALWWWGKPSNITTKSLGMLPDATSVLSRWEYDSGFIVHLEATWNAGSKFNASFRVVMEKGSLHMNAGKLNLITKDGVEEVSLSGMPDGYTAEIDYFLDCIINNKPVERCLPSDSALSVAYALGI